MPTEHTVVREGCGTGALPGACGSHRLALGLYDRQDQFRIVIRSGVWAYALVGT